MWVFRLSVRNSKYPKSKSCPRIDSEKIRRYERDVIPLSAEENKVYNPDNDKIFLKLKNELFEHGRLRQGWGYQWNDLKLDLTQSGNIWIENYIKLGWKIWGNHIPVEDACGRWNTLKHMVKMDIEDIVFIPRICDESKFTVATVCIQYSFQPMKDYYDFANVIEVKNIKEYSYEEHFPPKTFNPYQTPINQIKDHHQIFNSMGQFLEESYL